MTDATEKQGNIEVAWPVLATIVAKVASEVEGVAGLSGGVKSELAKFMGREAPGGVKIKEEGTEVSVELRLVAAYKTSLPALSQKVSERVKREIEALTEIKLSGVDVFIEDVVAPKEERQEGSPS